MPNCEIKLLKDMLTPEQIIELKGRIKKVLGEYQIDNPKLLHLQEALQTVSGQKIPLSKVREAFKLAANGADLEEKVALLGKDNLVITFDEKPDYAVDVGMKSAKNRFFRIAFELGGKDEVVEGVDIRTDKLRQEVSYVIGEVISTFMEEELKLKHNDTKAEDSYSLTGDTIRTDRGTYRDKKLMSEGIGAIRAARASAVAPAGSTLEEGPPQT